LSIYIEPNNCLCEQGFTTPMWLRIQSAQSSDYAFRKVKGASLSDTIWAKALRFPDSVVSLDTTLKDDTGTTALVGCTIAFNSWAGLSSPVALDYQSPDSMMKAIIYVRDSSGRLFKLQCTGYETYAPDTSSPYAKYDRAFRFFTIRWAVAPKGSDQFDATRILLSSRVRATTEPLRIQPQAFDLQGRQIEQDIPTAFLGLNILRFGSSAPVRLAYRSKNQGTFMGNQHEK
jgi:hypothetical protein